MPSIQHIKMHPESLLKRFADQLSPLLVEAELDSSFLTDPELECSAAAWVGLLELAGKHIDDSIGLRFGSEIRSMDLGVLGQVMRSMDHLEEVLQGISRYIITRSQAEKVDINKNGALVSVGYQIIDPTIVSRRQDVEFSFATMLSCFRELTASDIRPVRIEFEHAPPKDLSLHSEFFQCPLQFNQDSNRLYLNNSVLNLPVRTANKRLLQALLPFLEEQRKLRSQPTSLLNKVSLAIAAELKSGRVGLLQIADSLHMSVRTLQRRLGELDMEFGELVEEIRRAHALEYMGDSSYRITDVALMLGYRDVSSFSRAFRRWTDLTPSEYRKEAGL